jgi:tetratricopeptide (TPR) repeat protein
VLCCFPSIRASTTDGQPRFHFAASWSDSSIFLEVDLLSLIRFATLLSILLISIHTTLAQSQPGPPPSNQAQSPSLQTRPSPFEAARKLMLAGKYDEALSELQALAAQNPKIAGLSHELGAAYYKKGDFLKAAGYLKQAVEENPKDNEAVQLLGLSYYLSGRPNEAIPLLEKVQTWYPFANVDAAYILGVSYIQVKNYPQARTAFARMFDVPSDSAASCLFTARMLLRQEFDPIAEEYAQKAIALDPKLPLAHFLLGELYLYKSRIPEAITEFEKEKAINPAHAPTYYKLADAYSRIQKFDDAERLLQRSIWLDATSTGPYILMGKVLEKKGEFDLAARALERAVAMDPNNSITHHLLGQAYRDLGRNEDAERELKSAEKLQERESSK